MATRKSGAVKDAKDKAAVGGVLRELSTGGRLSSEVVNDLGFRCGVTVRSPDGQHCRVEWVLDDGVTITLSDGTDVSGQELLKYTVVNVWGEGWGRLAT